jgi:hypothetical protein
MPQATVMLPVVLTVLPRESTTWAVKLKVPGVVGVPVTAPVETLSESPGGNSPEVML